MPSVPSQYTVTCDICNEKVVSSNPVPVDWEVVAGPHPMPNNPSAVQPAFLCPVHVASFREFWKQRDSGIKITIS